MSLFYYSVIKIAIKLRLIGINWFFKWIILNILRNRDSWNWCSFCYRYRRLSLSLWLCIICTSKSSESIWFCLTRLLKWIIDNKLFRCSRLLIIVRHHKSSFVLWFVLCIIRFYCIIKIVIFKVIHIYSLGGIFIHLICLLILCFFHKWIYYGISFLHFSYFI